MVVNLCDPCVYTFVCFVGSSVALFMAVKIALTPSSSLRAVSTVTTTVRWEGTITPTWPYLPATGCSKWTAELCVILVVFRISVDTLISAPPLLLTQYRLASLPFLLFLPGSGMFDDGVYVYQIEPLQQTHSIVSYCSHREQRLLEYASCKCFCPAAHVGWPPAHMHIALPFLLFVESILITPGHSCF